MRNYWPLAPRPFAGPELPLAQVTALLQKLGLAGRHAVAEDLLQLVGAQVPVAQCAIFSFDGAARPRIVAVGDRARSDALPRISQDYVARFYHLDGCMQVMQSELAAAQRASPAHPHILLHRQRGEDVADRHYREVCYERPQVAERLAVLSLYEGRRWLSVNFYRGLAHGPFDARAVAVIEAFAPMIVQAVRLHHVGQAVNHDLAELMLLRLLRRCPDLTKRDVDVLRGLLSGHTTDGLADRMGIELSSARTYLKRVYAKLGISGQRELLGLLMAPELVSA